VHGVDLRWWAIIVAAVVNYVIGAAWYSPVLFAKPWQRLVGMGEGGMTPMAAMGGQAVLTVVSAIALAVVVSWSGAGNVVEGAWVGIVVGVGLLAVDALKMVVFERRAMPLFLISTGYTVVGCVVMGAILGAWH
jgi:Protein of unknown function (DUF1761)